MISPIPERHMLVIRLVLLVSWLALIGNLFIHAVLPIDGLTTHGIVSETQCVHIQSRCVALLPIQAHPSNVSALFWGAIVPASILLLLVFGHVTWRRICPLSWVSQVPRILGWQRVDNQGQPIRLHSNHWMVRYHTYFQLGFLYVGLCLRLLFLNVDSGWLGLWFLGTIAFAMTIGFLYAGKSWCQYFCPMAPVQHVFSEPVGLFTRKAHTQTRSLPRSLPQSICRTSAGDRSACVACTSTCMDIDAERRYWDWIERPEMQWTYYGYLGLIVGFFGSFYLYAENWDYYFSGVWTRESTLIADSVQSGFYFFNHQFYVIKLVAVPTVLAIAGWLAYLVGCSIEFFYLKWHQKIESNVSSAVLKHHLYSVSTFISFNTFFAFAGRPFLCQLPEDCELVSQVGLTVGILIVSSMWLLRALRRSPDRYDQERLASRWMVQLHKSKIDLPQLLGGRSVHALNREDWMTLRTTVAKVSLKHATQLDRSRLQNLVEEADQSLRGRYSVYQVQRRRRRIGQWADRKMSWTWKGDRMVTRAPEIPFIRHQALHTGKLPALLVPYAPEPSVKSVILRNN